MTFGPNLINADYDSLSLKEWINILEQTLHLETVRNLLIDLLLHHRRDNKLFKSKKKIEKEIEEVMVFIGSKDRTELADLILTMGSRAKSRVFILAKFGAAMRLVSPSLIKISPYDLVLAEYGTPYSVLANSPIYKLLYLRFLQMLLRYFFIFLLKPFSLLVQIDRLLFKTHRKFFSYFYHFLRAKIGDYDRYGRLFGVIRHYNPILSKFPIIIYSDNQGSYYGISGNHRILAANILKRKSIPALVVNPDRHDQPGIVFPTTENLSNDKYSLIVRGIIKFKSLFLDKAYQGTAKLNNISLSKNISSVRFRNKHALVLINNPLDFIQGFWLKNRFYESDNKGLLSYIVDRYRGGVFIDIGSNIGNHTLFFSIVCRATKVISIEPFPLTFQLLKQNINLNKLPNKCVELFNTAIGDREGYVGMEVPEKNNIGTAFISGEGKIKITTLDNLIKKIDLTSIRLIKIDCEGFNKQVLSGSKNALSEFGPDIFMECETNESLEEADLILRDFKYFRVPWFKVNATPTYFWTKDIRLAEQP